MPDEFSWIPSFVFRKERLLIADMALASCEFMFEETRNYVKQRKAFGKTIAHLQVSLNRDARRPLLACVCFKPVK